MNALLDALPSAATLARLPERVLHLIKGLGKLPYLASARSAAGFTGDEAALGLSLLDRATNPAAALDAEARRAARDAALLALHRWYTEWAEMARALARNRRELIVSGLARPRAREAAARSAA